VPMKIGKKPGNKPVKKIVEKVKIDKEFRRIAEKNLRKDRELLERLAKI
jgi:hypothetical protein